MKVRSGKTGAIALVAGGAVVGAVLAGTIGANAASSGTGSTGTAAPPAATGAPPPGQPGPGGPNPVRSDEKLVTGSTLSTLTAEALKAVPGGTIIRVETDAGDATYEAHMRNASGGLVTVKFDKNLAVIKVEDGMGQGDPRPAGAPPGGPGAPGASNGTASGSSTSTTKA